jgi:hypothetical protein
MGMNSSISGDAESLTYSLINIVIGQPLPWDHVAPRKMGGKELSVAQLTMLLGDLRIAWLLGWPPHVQVLCL